MKKCISLVLALTLVLSLGSLTMPLASAEESSVLKMLVPENDPASLPWPMADISSGAVQHPVWDAFSAMLNERNLSIEFELIEKAQYAVVSQTRLASGLDLPDIMNVRAIPNTQLMTYANAGLLLPVSDIIDEYCTQEAKDTISTKYPFYYAYTANPTDGKTYVYGQLTSYKVDGVNNTEAIMLKIRYDWLQKLDLEMPTSVQDLLEIGKAFHEQDANGNGIIGDEVYCIEGTAFYSMGDFFGLVPSLLTGIVNDGSNQVVSPWYQEGVKDYFAFMNEMYEEGLISLDVSVTQLNAENTLIGNYQYAAQSYLEAANPDPDCFYAPVGLLTGMNGIEPVVMKDPTQMYLSSYQFAVTNACTDLSAVGRLLDILFSEEYETLTIAGIEGVNYTLLEGNGDRAVNGVNVNFIVPDNSVDAMRAAGVSTGYRLWGKGIFPRINTVDIAFSFMEKKTQSYEEAGDWQNAFRNQKLVDSYSYPLSSYAEIVESMPTEEEAERKGELATDLETYASELWSNLITGASSLDDWDSYIADMQAIGLDELIAIDQALYTRWVEACK